MIPKQKLISYTAIICSICTFILLQINFKNNSLLEELQSKYIILCVDYNQKINTLVQTVQSDTSVQIQFFDSKPETIKVENFIGVIFWTIESVDPEEFFEIIPGSEVHIVETGAACEFKVPEKATGYLMRGNFINIL